MHGGVAGVGGQPPPLCQSGRAGLSYQRVLFMRRPLGEPLKHLRLTAVIRGDREESDAVPATSFWSYLSATVLL